MVKCSIARLRVVFSSFHYSKTLKSTVGSDIESQTACRQDMEFSHILPGYEPGQVSLAACLSTSILSKVPLSQSCLITCWVSSFIAFFDDFWLMLPSRHVAHIVEQPKGLYLGPSNSLLLNFRMLHTG